MGTPQTRGTLDARGFDVPVDDTLSGDADRAFEWLDRAVGQGAAGMRIDLSRVVVQAYFPPPNPNVRRNHAH